MDTVTRRQAGKASSHGAQVRHTPTLDAAVENFVASIRRKSAAPRTLETYRRYLVHHEHGKVRGKKAPEWKPITTWGRSCGVTHVEDLTREAVENYLAEQQKLTTAKVYFDLSVFVKRLLKYCVEEGYLATIPLKIARPKVPQAELAVFTDDEVKAMADLVSREHPRDWAVFMLLVCTGLRSNEVCSLKVDDVRFERQEVIVRKEVAKARRERMVPMGNSYKALRDYWATRADLDKTRFPSFFLSFWGSPIFSGGRGNAPRTLTKGTSYSGAPLTRTGLYQLVRKWGRLAKVREARCSPHTFRHYFAVSFLRAGGDLLHLKVWLGHSKFEMTEKYVRLASADLHAAARKVSPGAKFVKPRSIKATPG